MNICKLTAILRTTTLLLALLTGAALCHAQDDVVKISTLDTINVVMTPDDMAPDDMLIGDLVSQADSLATAADSLAFAKKLKRQKRDWLTWRPDPKRALWLAVVIPGAGQIYNRKYWKLPIVYGGFVGCVYAMQWNNQMYKDYSQAYIDICDNDPNTQSYNQFLHLGTKITSSNEERFKQLFKKRKDYYRRYRDLSFFILVGVYAVSVVDAYIDASLSDFDISKDLSMKVAPTIISGQRDRNLIRSSALGVHCSLTF